MDDELPGSFAVVLTIRFIHGHGSIAFLTMPPVLCGRVTMTLVVVWPKTEMSKGGPPVTCFLNMDYHVPPKLDALGFGTDVSTTRRTRGNAMRAIKRDGGGRV